MLKLKKDIDILEIDNINQYLDYESCEKIAPKWAIAKFKKELERSKNAQYGKFDYITVLDNVKGEYNTPRIVRTVNILGGREIFVSGIKYFNPYPSVGGFRHTKLSFFEKIEDCILKLKELDYDIFALLPPKYNGSSIYKNNFKAKSAFIAGHEQFGLSFNISDYDFIKPIYIPQFGKVESLNVSVAVSIVASEYVRQIST